MALIKSKDLRIFGLIWSVIFGIIAYSNRENFDLVSVSSIFIFFLIVTTFISIFFPIYLTFLYKKWVIVGGFIGKINSLIILFLLFYTMITPISFILKLFKKDLLGTKIDLKSATYWIDREEQPNSMKNQF